MKGIIVTLISQRTFININSCKFNSFICNPNYHTIDFRDFVYLFSYFLSGKFKFLQC